MKDPLPIDPLVPEIVSAVHAGSNLVLVAEPGAGKTTRVPAALLATMAASHGSIVVLEPRRLAARMAARRVAQELGEPLGRRVGYRVRFDECGGPTTRLWFVTEGIVLRQLVHDPQLSDAAIVVFDEFHERHISADLALTWLRHQQQRTRPDLRLVVMSATLDADPLTAFLDATMVRASGRAYPVAIDHLAKADPRPLPLRAASAVQRCLGEQESGDLLVFLPGMFEIRRTQEQLAQLNPSLVAYPLHGELSLDEQDRAIRPAPHRKVVLATNVAESSLTIEGVTTVIDSGLMRSARWSTWSGLPQLTTTTISRASAAQRAGRAGRTGPGRALRLYSKFEHDSWPAHELPELLRGDLTDLLLTLRRWGITDPTALTWFEAPPRAAIDSAEQTLVALGAIDLDGALTARGQAMSDLALHPRLARMLLEARARGAGARGATLAALLDEERLVGDPLQAVASFSPRPGTNTARTEEALLRWLQIARPRRGPLDDASEEALGIALVAAFPDRIARLRHAGSRDALLCDGGAARLADELSLASTEPFVAVAARETPAGPPRIDAAAPIRAEWLLDLFPTQFREEQELSWNEPHERVEAVERLCYRQLVLAETRRSDPRGPEVAALLAQQALARGAASFADAERCAAWCARTAFVGQLRPDFPVATTDTLNATLAALCADKRSLAELRSLDLLAALQGQLTPSQRAELERFAPERLELPCGRRVAVHYEAAKSPWIASRLQDFFGLNDAPVIGGGAVPLVVQLLAPNQRPVQVTSDLAGFWTRHYPQLRRELMRRYPKHRWPEDPQTSRR